MKDFYKFLIKSVAIISTLILLYFIIPLGINHLLSN